MNLILNVGRLRYLEDVGPYFEDFYIYSGMMSSLHAGNCECVFSSGRSLPSTEFITLAFFPP